MIIGIVAVSRNFAIGKAGKLPWHYSADLRFFKETTLGNTVLMGSRTWESIGRELPGRMNVILTRSGNVEAPGEIMKLASVDEAVQLAGLLNGDVYVIGGAKTFGAFADKIDKWIVSEIPVEVDDADVYLPRTTFERFTVEESREIGDGIVVRTMKRIPD
jgi:dihydrofolate reductase